jgi:hypothetical protein
MINSRISVQRILECIIFVQKQTLKPFQGTKNFESIISF